MRKQKKAELTLETIVIAVLVLVVLAILLWLAYKYIWGAGNEIGGLSKCQARANGADCVTNQTACDSKFPKTGGTAFYLMGGCNKDSPGKWCCIPKDEK